MNSNHKQATARRLLSVSLIGLFLAVVTAGTASADALCIKTGKGGKGGKGLTVRDACHRNEVQIATFDGTALEFSVPLKINSDLGEPGLLLRSGRTTSQTILFEAWTGPDDFADIIDGPLEPGSVYHHLITLMAKTADGRASVSEFGYSAVSVPHGDADVQTTRLYTSGNINPPPRFEAFGRGDRRILRVYGNGVDSIEWSAVVLRSKIEAPGR